jgi:predicted Zn-dependent protease
MRTRTSKPTVSRRMSAAVLCLMLAAPQAMLARYQPNPGMNFFSRDDEINLGKQNAAEVEKQMPIVKDAALNRYIQNLGAKLAANAPGYKYPYTFKIVNQKEINAFALPGGPVYVNLGTIQAADTEAQLAGVMAHEISHVVMRHSTHQASKAMMAQVGLGILGAKMGGGAAAQAAQLGISFGVGSLFMKYSRDMESQADLIGADIAHDSGFNPQGMVDFFQKLEQEGGSRGSQFFSDHPNPGNRAQAVSKEIATLEKRSFVNDSADFRTIKQKVGGMKPLTAQEIAAQQGQGQPGGATGTVQRNSSVMPSSNFKTLNHSRYSVSYPDNWQVMGDSESAVTIAPKAGIAGDAVAYGTIISPYQAEQGSTLDQSTHELLQQLRQSNPDLKQIGNDEGFKLNGQSARSVVLVGTSPLQSNGKAEQERDWLVTVQQKSGDVVYFVFIAPQSDFSQLQPAFEKMLKSFKGK